MNGAEPRGPKSTTVKLFQVDPRWYEHHWLSDPASRRRNAFAYFRRILSDCPKWWGHCRQALAAVGRRLPVAPDSQLPHNGPCRTHPKRWRSARAGRRRSRSGPSGPSDLEAPRPRPGTDADQSAGFFPAIVVHCSRTFVWILGGDIGQVMPKARALGTAGSRLYRVILTLPIGLEMPPLRADQ